MFKCISKIIKPKKVKVQKYKAHFITVDNVRHRGQEFKYGIVDRLVRRSIPEYIMIDIESDGYITDESGLTMYPLTNVISIDWVLLDEKLVEDTFDRFQIFVDADDIN